MDKGKGPDQTTADPRSALAAAPIEESYRQLPIALVVNLLNGSILVVVLWGAVATSVLLLWLLTLVIVTLARYLMLRALTDIDTARRQRRRWTYPFVLGALAAGLVWGTAGVLLFHPTSFPHQVFLAFVLGGMIAGAVPLLSSLDHAYECFAMPIVLPICARFLSSGDPLHLTMGAMSLIFGFSMLASSHQVRRLFRSSEELRMRLWSSIEARQTLQQMLHLDDLTGIANRRRFDEVLEGEWRRARREGTMLALIMADIDHFKQYNDHFGHPAGDLCLIQVAQTVAGQMKRPGDLAARIGGEELACLLPATPLESAEVVAERIRLAVLDLDIAQGPGVRPARVSLSLGVASSQLERVRSGADLVRIADQALYEAKHRGRNQMVTADP